MLSSWKKCSSKDDLKNSTNEDCYVRIDNVTEISVMEKQSEYVKAAQDFDKLKSEAAREERRNSLVTAYQDMSFYNSISGGMTNNNYVSAELCEGRVVEELTYANSNLDAATKLQTSKNEAYVCQMFGGKYHCIPQRNNSSCKADAAAGTWIKNKNTSSSFGLGGLETAINNLDNPADDVFNYETKSDAAGNYNNAISSYNSNQKALNEKKQEYEDLKSKADTSVQGAISSGTQLLLNSGTKIATTAMEMSNNKGVMTGNCYLGDPSMGNMILSDQQAKKVTWNSF